jgi:hypothetical protein
MVVGRLTGIETVLLDLDGTLYVAARSCPAPPKRSGGCATRG